jgi:hypothetical protein
MINENVYHSIKIFYKMLVLEDMLGLLNAPDS